MNCGTHHQRRHEFNHLCPENLAHSKRPKVRKLLMEVTVSRQQLADF